MVFLGKCYSISGGIDTPYLFERIAIPSYDVQPNNKMTISHSIPGSIPMYQM